MEVRLEQTFFNVAEEDGYLEVCVEADIIIPLGSVSFTVFTTPVTALGN